MNGDVEALHGAWADSLRDAWAGGPEAVAWSPGWERTVRDVRVVVAGTPVRVWDGFAYAGVPWSLFPHVFGPGEEVAEDVGRLRRADAPTALSVIRRLWGRVCHAGQPSTSRALAVPFLLRIAADPSTHHRSEVLWLAGGLARRVHDHGFGRGDLLRVGYADDEWAFAACGYLQNWTIEAVRGAITADAGIVTALLDDPDADARCLAAYVLAASSGEIGAITAALRVRLRVEDGTRARACLVLAIAQLAREHADESVPAWMRTRWSDPRQPPEVRVGAALGWLCLVDDPAPATLRATLEDCVTPELAHELGSVPWLVEMGPDGDALLHTLRRLLEPTPRL
ncbi:HEAT repeat domain-containing protein [Embleya scabrispora]|nr:HEAT repeat domain-containing protein [Embleya scabrispora]